MSDTPSSRAAGLLHLRRDGLAKGDPIPLPLTMASTFHAPGDLTGFHQYGRFSNPTWDGTEEMLSYLEDAPAFVFPSGMAAISAAFFALLKAGDRILLPTDGYHTTRILADRFLRSFGVHFDTRPTASFLDGGFDGYRLVFLESPSNPMLDICDITAAAAAIHKAGGLLIVDNTTMTPFGQRPLDLGADIVVAADTKAPNGHSDVLAGHVASRNADIMAAVREWRTASGSISSPFDAWLLHRGLETLEVRFDRMCTTAELLAPRIKAHPAVKSLRFPGLPETHRTTSPARRCSASAS